MMAWRFVKILPSACLKLTVEPILFMFMFSGSFMWLTLQSLIYTKVCSAKFNATVCASLNRVEFKLEEDRVQTDTSYWFLARIICDEIPAILASLFYGNLSDHVSRKMALVLPLVGMVLANSVYLANAMYPQLPLWTILLGSLGSGVFGGWIACSLTVYSYLSSVSDANTRTVRMATAECLTVIGSATGHLLSGDLLDRTSHSFVLTISLAIFCVNVMYVHVCVTNLPNQLDSGCGGCMGVVQEACSSRRISEGLTVLTRPRQHNHRLYIVVLMISMCLSVLGGSATWILGYLYLKRQPLSWTQTLYGYYVAAGHTLKGLMVVLVLPIIKLSFHMTETSIVMLALGLHGVAEILFGLCTKTWMVFSVLLVDFLYGAVHTCYRSLLSTLVGPNEYGQVFATLGSLQSLCILISSLVYNVIYPLTLEVWAGLSFILGASLLFCAMAFIFFIHIDMTKTCSLQRPLPVPAEKLVVRERVLEVTPRSLLEVAPHADEIYS